MARVQPIRSPADYATLSGPAPEDIKALFDHLFPGIENPEIDAGHASYGVAARNPRLTLQLAKLTQLVVLELDWSKRRDLLELSIQTLSLHFRSDLMFKAHVATAQKFGISAELQAAIPYWRTTDLFDDEQRLVIEYTQAVVVGDVPDALFARVVDRFGETQAVEFTTAAAFFAFWAMFMNATRP